MPRLDATHAKHVDDATMSLNAILSALADGAQLSPAREGFIRYEANRALMSLREVSAPSLSLVGGDAA